MKKDITEFNTDSLPSFGKIFKAVVVGLFAFVGVIIGFYLLLVLIFMPLHIFEKIGF